MRDQTERSQSGFTLIEILVVLVVLGIVSAIALVSLFGALDRAKQRATMADMRIISRAIQSYIVDHNYAPPDGGGLETLAPLLVPYQTNVLPVEDHWHHDIAYEADGDSYTLSSFGRDGIDGADISLASRFDFDLDIVLVNGVFVASPE